MNAFLPQFDTAYEIGAMAIADPIWAILEGNGGFEFKERAIREIIDKFYNRSMGTQILGKDKDKIKALKDEVDKIIKAGK